jgi:DNA mismatch repair protein MutL
MQQRNEIRVLPKEVADKIAAGEVVDRPLSVVKELLENAIDAGADQIVVEIKGGGKTYIRVTDNGCGIPGDELPLAILRHATSKIKNEKDLEAIETLGFRGEALASIAAVSRVTIITRTRSEVVGTRMRIEGGNVLQQDGIGCPEGTTIQVEDLFFNTPARLKFLKSDGSESTAVIDFVSRMALAYPMIRLRLISNEMTLFATNGKGAIETNIATIFSKDIGGRLLRTEAESAGLSVLLFHSPIDTTRKSRRHQIYFINGRHVESQIIDRALSKAYRERIPEGRFPVVFLFLHADPARLDVNIHPNKREVRFDRPEEMEEFVTAAIQKGLLAGGSPITRIESQKPRLVPKQTGQETQVDIKQLLSTERTRKSEFHIREEQSPDKPSDPVRERLSDLNIVSTVFGTYIVAQREDNLYFIDQHAAHERVLYERFLALVKDQRHSGQVLIAPFLFEFTSAMAALDTDWQSDLGRLGFVLEKFGPKTYRVSEIPSFTDIAVATSFLEDFFDQLTDEQANEDSHALEKMILHACRQAVKANDHLDIQEIKRLLEDLDRTENPLSCPHGRPTYIQLKKHEIERLFRRV